MLDGRPMQKFIVLANSILFSLYSLGSDCQSTLTPPHWHIVSEHYRQNSTFRAALKRFDIQLSMGIEAKGLTPRGQVSNYFKAIDAQYGLSLKNSEGLGKDRSANLWV